MTKKTNHANPSRQQVLADVRDAVEEGLMEWPRNTNTMPTMELHMMFFAAVLKSMVADGSVKVSADGMFSLAKTVP